MLKIGDPELLLLLAVHAVTGIASETVADMLWDEARADPPGDLRKKRSKLRLKLRRLVPDLPADPLPGDAYKGEKVVLLDTWVVSSDVHEFAELLKCAEKLYPPAAIEGVRGGPPPVRRRPAGQLRHGQLPLDVRRRAAGCAHAAQ